VIHDFVSRRPSGFRRSVSEDLGFLARGILDPASFVAGYRRYLDPVEVRTTSLVPDGARVHPRELVQDPHAFTQPVLVGTEWRDAAWGMQRRVYREIRRTHNLRLNVGRDQFQRIATFGDIGTSLNGLAATGTATAPTATTWTSATSFPTAVTGAGNTGLQGKLVFVANTVTSDAFVNPVVGVILSNTATVLTVDQWYAVPITGAVGTTPAAASAAFVLPQAAPTWWVALSTSTSTPAATDVTRSADGLWADGTATGTATEQTTSGLARAYCGNGGSTAPTFPGAGQEEFLHTWTYTGAVAVTIDKVVLFNAAPGAGNIPMLETLLNASATVAASGDTIQLNGWTITF
jgi:hypothetical protein